jgi:hypothetical protein
MRAGQRRPRAFFTDTALCPSGRRRCPGSTPWRARAGSVFSVPTWTASPRRRSAGRASWSACTPRRAGSRYCRRAAAPDPRGRRGRPARAARHRPPARPHTRCFHPRGAGSRQPPRRRGRAARDDRTSRLAGVRRGLSSPTASPREVVLQPASRPSPNPLRSECDPRPLAFRTQPRGVPGAHARDFSLFHLQAS